MDKKISFSEELLSGFLDGELAEEDAAKIYQFASSSADLKEDLTSLSKIGELFSSSFSNAPDDLNTWEAIQGRLPVKQSVPSKSDAKPVLSIERPKQNIWGSIFRPGYGAALALGLFAVGMVSSQWTELPTNKGQVVSKISESDLPIDDKAILVPLIPKSRSGGQTFVSNGGAPGRINDFNYSPQFISPQQLGAEHPARGAGVRDDGMQIDWMKNSKDVRFLRHKNQNLPPMIWLGELQ